MIHPNLFFINIVAVEVLEKVAIILSLELQLQVETNTAGTKDNMVSLLN